VTNQLAKIWELWNRFIHSFLSAKFLSIKQNYRQKFFHETYTNTDIIPDLPRRPWYSSLFNHAPQRSSRNNIIQNVARFYVIANE
jgi:hypothetical protein